MTEFFAPRGSDDVHERRRENAVSSFLHLGRRLKAAKESVRVPEGMDALVRTIEGEIIPRLMLSHQSAARGADVICPNALSPTEEDRTRFLWVVMKESAAASRAFVNDLIARGISRETIYLDLLTNAARRLGELWEEDLCDFTDVTIGLCRLHQVLREQSSLYDVEYAGRAQAPKILLATACADQHVFGVVMVAEFFRREGWAVWCEPAAAQAELLKLVAKEWFDVIGLSAACTTNADLIGDEITALRAASRNPDVSVLVGGRLFAERPDLVAEVGADGSASDARLAAEAGQNLLVSPMQLPPAPRI